MSDALIAMRSDLKLRDWRLVWDELRKNVRDAVAKYIKDNPPAAWAAWAAFRAKFLEIWGEKFAPTTTSLKESAIELLEAMVAVGEERTAA